jgi:N-acetylglutamate synthase-like GNAT family acetyltransferase
MHGDLQRIFGERLAVRPLGLDDFSSVRHLHARALCAQTLDVLSQEEIDAFLRLVRSPAYSDILAKEEVHGAWLDGELVGTASWQPTMGANSIARIGGVFVRHPRFGIGRRLLAEVEHRARQSGFVRYSAWATSNAVPFFERLGYTQVSRGHKTLGPHCALPVTFLRKEPPPRSAMLM